LGLCAGLVLQGQSCSALVATWKVVHLGEVGGGRGTGVMLEGAIESCWGLIHLVPVG
jgi:hypothetical protein